MIDSNSYRYNSFTLRTVLSDMRFNGGVKPGTNIGTINLSTTDNQAFQWPRVDSPKLLLLVFGSRTCPATISTIPDIKELYTKFGKDVEFAYLYVREAHPGNIISQPHTIQGKTSHACSLQSEQRIPWKIAIDTIDGEIHHRLATRPNAAYLIDSSGIVVFRTLFAADAYAIKNAIKNYFSGQPIIVRERNPIIFPILKLIGITWEVVGNAGKTAQRDILLHTPFLYLPSRLSVMLKGATPLVRGSISMVLTFIIIALMIYITIQWL